MDDVLRRNPLFAALDDEQAAELRASMSEVTLARGDSLFHEETRATACTWSPRAR